LADAHLSNSPPGTPASGSKPGLGYFRKHLIIPPEHGAWIWLAGPFAVGVVAGRGMTFDVVLCAVAAMAAFFGRQPATLLVKIVSGRRSRHDLRPVLLWLIVDSGLAAGLAGWLALRGYTQLVLLALPALPVFAWYLWLVSRREERRQTGVHILAAGVLALTGPAGYWAAAGRSPSLPWLIWGVMWFQAAASIVFVQLRLEQRGWDQPGSLGWRLARGWRPLMYSGFNELASLAAWAVLGTPPLWIGVAFGLMLADVTDGVLRPALGARPSTVGIRQGFSSAVFVCLAALSFYRG
jgi:hypothetical protein